jgi:hypothetical protein
MGAASMTPPSRGCGREDSSGCGSRPIPAPERSGSTRRPVGSVWAAPTRASCDSNFALRTRTRTVVAEFITFLLAAIGYAGLTMAAVFAARGHVPVLFWRSVAAVILMHVVLVWVVRYEGQLSEAIRNGYVGFVLFHGALLAILASVVLPDRLARPLIMGAFAVVTVGALGAVFRYEVVAQYRIPVVLCAILGSAGSIRAYRSQQRRPTLT